ncbi:hypothetical protein GGS26DRAFT_584709 [Hypomontagnella submonticulosa]|nr:hypothetical protein GGS26DRAFT_584709 [Hypomontagnella submonticulosa]
MGSVSQDTYVLPEAKAPTLVLAHPTDVEKLRTWTLNHNEWGGALTLEEYLKREPYFTGIPLTRDGGMTHWILTDSAWSPELGGDRPVLASCESIRKRVLVAAPGDTEVRNGVGHGIGSVFTYPEFRSQGYGGRMLKDVGAALRKWQSGSYGGCDVVCSALWSDIGKLYYAKKGWAAFPSLHVEFPASAGQAQESEGKVLPITYDNLEALCQRDEQLLGETLLRTARETGRTSVAFAPDHDQMRWHLYRDDFITSILFKSAGPNTIKGALAGTQEGRRVWALWSRSYHGSIPAKNVDNNKLYILRLFVESEATEGENPSDETLEAFKAVVQMAQREAAAWHLGKIDMWNPTPITKKLIERCGIQHRWVDREEDSIPSMMWYGDEDVRDIEWVANEKYCWC